MGDLCVLPRAGLLCGQANHGPDAGGAEDQVAWYVKHGDLKESIDIAKLVDQSYVNYALKKLGPYQK